MAIPVKEKNVKLKVKRDFYDKTNSLKLKKKGEEMNVNPDRAEKLIRWVWSKSPTPTHPKRLLRRSRFCIE